MPGGDKLGKRPLDWHFEALRAMGAQIDYQGESIVATCNQLKGTTYRFPKNSHTGTETLIMAGVLAKGKTIIENAALEPEIDDLIQLLNDMGAHIRRREGKIIEIEGVSKLHGAIHKIIPDRNEAVSYACAAIATKGDIIVENAKPEHLEAFLDKLDEIGAGYEIGTYGIRFFYKGQLKAADIITQPQPGFMTDWQPLWAVLATQCKGISVIHEAVYTQRFQYLEHLNQMGVKTELFNPEVQNPEKTYNFNLKEDQPSMMHAVKIHGIAMLKPIVCEVKDLRHGATMVLAAMITKGISRLTNIEQIDRGYEDLDGRLNEMGAQINRVI
jgi:UDP-N-acetylglucosamine 1-carboxyvinyltransferase